MKFDEKYPTATPLFSVDAFLMRGLLEYPCTICKQPTNWIYLPASVPACSEECVDGKWKILEAAGRREDTKEKVEGATCFVCERKFGSSVDTTKISVYAHRKCLGDVNEPITPAIKPEIQIEVEIEKIEQRAVRRARGQKMSAEEKQEFEEWRRSQREASSNVNV